MKDKGISTIGTIDPAVSEFKDLGRDFGRADLAARKKVILANQALLHKAKGLGLSKQELLNKYKEAKSIIPESANDPIRQGILGYRKGYRAVREFIPKIQPMKTEITNIINNAQRDISVNARLAYRKARGAVGDAYSNTTSLAKKGYDRLMGNS